MENRRSQALAEKFAIDGNRFVGEKTQSDLRSGAVMRGSDGLAAMIGDLNDIAGLCVAEVGDVARKEPGVAVRSAVGGFAIDADGGQFAIFALISVA